jgi:hypothetical protein
VKVASPPVKHVVGATELTGGPPPTVELFSPYISLYILLYDDDYKGVYFERNNENK